MKIRQQEIIPLFGLSVFLGGTFINLTALAGTMRDRSHGMLNGSFSSFALGHCCFLATDYTDVGAAH